MTESKSDRVAGGSMDQPGTRSTAADNIVRQISLQLCIAEHYAYGDDSDETSNM